MRSSLLDKIIVAAAEVQEARNNLGEKMEALEALTGKRRTRAISARQISDAAIGPSSSGRRRRKKRKMVDAQLTGIKKKAAEAYERIIAVVKANDGKANMDDFRAHPGVSVKNLKRLIEGMVERGFLKTTYGNKYKLGEQAQAAPN